MVDSQAREVYPSGRRGKGPGMTFCTVEMGNPGLGTLTRNSRHAWSVPCRLIRPMVALAQQACSRQKQHTAGRWSTGLNNTDVMKGQRTEGAK